MAIVPVIPIENVGQIGIITDIPPFQLPPNAWSAGNNVRIRDQGIKKCAGFTEIFASCPIPPYHIFPLADTSSVYWVALGLGKAYVFKNDGGAWTDITRSSGGDYSATADEGWAHTVLGGVPIVTNFKDAPQFWALTTGKYNTSTNLAPLTNWRGPGGAAAATSYAKSIKSFKSFLIALNLNDTASGTEYTQMVKWSGAASAHSVPATWNETTTTADAGEQELSDTPGDIIDGLQLGETFVVYKEDATYLIQFIGTPFIFSFKMLSPTVGILAKNCVSEFEGGHFFIGKSDVYLNNGQTITPLLPNRLKRELFDNLDGDYYKRSFTVADYNRKEMLACFPTTGSTFPNRALIWNWVNNTFTIRDLPRLSSVGFGNINVSTDTNNWDDYSTPAGTTTNTWDVTTEDWGQRTFDKGASKVVFATTGLSTGAISAATKADPVRITTSTAHGLVSADKIIIDGVAGMTELNAPDGSAYPAAGVLYAKIDTTNPTTEFTLYEDAALASALDGTGFSTWTSGGSIYKERLFQDDAGNTEDGTAMTSYIERTGLSLTQDGTNDQSQVKYVRAIWPKMDITGTGTVNISVAKQMYPDESIAWAGPYTFDPRTQSKISCTVTGRYYGVKIESSADLDWTLNGVGYEIEDAGYR